MKLLQLILIKYLKWNILKCLVNELLIKFFIQKVVSEPNRKVGTQSQYSRVQALPRDSRQQEKGG